MGLHLRFEEVKPDGIIKTFHCGHLRYEVIQVKAGKYDIWFSDEIFDIKMKINSSLINISTLKTGRHSQLTDYALVHFMKYIELLRETDRISKLAFEEYKEALENLSMMPDNAIDKDGNQEIFKILPKDFQQKIEEEYRLIRIESMIESRKTEDLIREQVRLSFYDIDEIRSSLMDVEEQGIDGGENSVSESVEQAESDEEQI